jgi:hypothetical protein
MRQILVLTKAEQVIMGQYQIYIIPTKAQNADEY